MHKKHDLFVILTMLTDHAKLLNFTFFH